MRNRLHRCVKFSVNLKFKQSRYVSEKNSILKFYQKSEEQIESEWFRFQQKTLSNKFQKAEKWEEKNLQNLVNLMKFFDV